MCVCGVVCFLGYSLMFRYSYECLQQPFYRRHASCHFEQYPVHPFGSLIATSIVAGLGEVVEWWQAKGIKSVKTLKGGGQLVKAPSRFADANVG